MQLNRPLLVSVAVAVLVSFIRAVTRVGVSRVTHHRRLLGLIIVTVTHYKFINRATISCGNK